MKKKRFSSVGCFVLLVCSLWWNYAFFSMDIPSALASLTQRGAQFDSELLVIGSMKAGCEGTRDRNPFGLGKYYTPKGIYLLESSRLDDDCWEGYGTRAPFLQIDRNPVTESFFPKTAYVRFSGGDTFAVAARRETEKYFYLDLDTQKIPTEADCGSLFDAEFLDADGAVLESSGQGIYKSCYGLQGKFFGRLSELLCRLDSQVGPGNVLCRVGVQLAIYRLLCSGLLALVLALMVMLLAKKYDRVLAGCFFIGFLLSPWLAAFGRNLYWVPFTWFVPMLLGLVCSLWAQNRYIPWLCSVGVFLAVLVKSLCGYEYLSTILLSMVSFLASDFLGAAFRRDREKAIRLFSVILRMSVFAVAGFCAAMCLHGMLRGGGNLAEGIRTIIQEDAVRRTVGISENIYGAADFQPENVTALRVIGAYLLPKSSLLSGIPGVLFPLLIVLSGAILVLRRKAYGSEKLWLYVLFFLAPVSWFVLAINHSYVHQHVNFVLWYFGFVQMCLYPLAREAICRFVPGKDEN